MSAELSVYVPAEGMRSELVDRFENQGKNTIILWNVDEAVSSVECPVDATEAEIAEAAESAVKYMNAENPPEFFSVYEVVKNDVLLGWEVDFD